MSVTSQAEEFFHLYINDSSTYHRAELDVQFPILSSYYFDKSDQNWFQVYKRLGKTFSGSNIQRVTQLVSELTNFTPVDQQPSAFSHNERFHNTFLRLFTSSLETFLEFMIMAAHKHDGPFYLPQSSPSQLTPFASQFVSINTHSSPTSPTTLPPQNTSSTTITALANALTFDQTAIFDLITSLPLPPLLHATLSGQVEFILQLLRVPTVDINARCWAPDQSPCSRTLLALVDTHLERTQSDQDISKHLVFGVNPATIAPTPNRLIACPPFPLLSCQLYAVTRFQRAFTLQSISLTPLERLAILLSINSLQVYCDIINRCFTVIFAVTSLLQGSSNREYTNRRVLREKHPLLYATEDSDVYPEAPLSSRCPLFFPPAKPTPVDARARVRSTSGTKSNTGPLMRYVHVTPTGWSRIEDEHVLDFQRDDATRERTYLLAGSKLPRTLFTDALDTLSLLTRSGAETMHILLCIKPLSSSQPLAMPAVTDPSFHHIDISELHRTHTDLVNFICMPSVPLTVTHILPNNSFTTISRLSLRLGLVRYQRWVNNTSNTLVNVFMARLGFMRIPSHAYDKYNGHQWPYAYIKSTPVAIQARRPTTTTTTTTTAPPLLQFSHQTSPSATPTTTITPIPFLEPSTGPIRDIKQDYLYQILLAYVTTARSTQVKLGIQDVPVARSFSPAIPPQLSSIIRRYKRYKRAIESTQGDPTFGLSSSSFPGSNADIASGCDETDDAATPASMPCSPSVLSRSTSETAAHFEPTVDGMDNQRTHIPTNWLPPALRLFPWFYSIHFTQRHFKDVADKNKPKTTPFGEPKRSTSTNKSQPVPCARGPIFLETQRRIQERQLQRKTEREQNAVVIRTVAAPVAEPTPTPITPALPVVVKPVPKMSAADIADIMGSSSAKRKQKKPSAAEIRAEKKKALEEAKSQALEKANAIKAAAAAAEAAKKLAEEAGEAACAAPESGINAAAVPPETVSAVITTAVEPPCEEIDATANQQQPHVPLPSQENQENSTPSCIPPIVETAVLSKPTDSLASHRDALVLAPSDLPKPVLLCNFYDSDDDLPLLRTIARQAQKDITHIDETIAYDRQQRQLQTQPSSQTPPQLEQKTQRHKSNTKLVSPNQTSTNNDRIDDTIDESLNVRRTELVNMKKTIDHATTAPFFQDAAHIHTQMELYYQQAVTHSDTYSNMSGNQVVLGSTALVNSNPNNAPSTPLESSQTTPASAIQPSLPQSTQISLVNPVASGNDLDMLQNDHFVTHELAHALEMASTLSTLVLLYCGQNTHRGYTDMQYDTKVWQASGAMFR